MVNKIREHLFALNDEEYKKFNSALIPTISPDTFIGVRTPALRKLAKELANEPKISEFLYTLPHQYYEENNLHAFIIERIQDYDECVRAIDIFLPFVDNWATCDSMRPTCFKKNTERLTADIYRWLCSDHTYTVRFGIEMLMTHYLDEHFEPRFLDTVADIRSNEYYINMMTAWYFATALAKQYSSTLPYIEECRLAPWTHNKAIQKARESYRITDVQKAYLKTLKVHPV